ATRAACTPLLEPARRERRPFVKAGTPEQMADELKPYLNAGFTGFTFNNSIYRTTDQIAVIGELLRIVEGAPAPAARHPTAGNRRPGAGARQCGGRGLSRRTSFWLVAALLAT